MCIFMLLVFYAMFSKGYTLRIFNVLVVYFGYSYYLVLVNKLFTVFLIFDIMFVALQV